MYVKMHLVSELFFATLPTTKVACSSTRFADSLYLHLCVFSFNTAETIKPLVVRGIIFMYFISNGVESVISLVRVVEIRDTIAFLHVSNVNDRMIQKSNGWN